MRSTTVFTHWHQTGQRTGCRDSSRVLSGTRRDELHYHGDPAAPHYFINEREPMMPRLTP